jgi:5'-phosphate synthase pdxT subunit
VSAGGVPDPVVGVLALQGDVREHEHTLRVCGAITRRVRTPDDLAAVDALVLPGGESTTMSRLAVTFDLVEPLRARVRAGMPAFGSCAGMILLADRVEGARADYQGVGGMDVTVRRNAFGRQVDSFEADLDVPALGDGAPLHAVFIRAPWVESAGAAVEVLARVPLVAGRPAGPAAGRIVAVRQGTLLATAFHPELTGDHRVHRLFLTMVAQALGANGPGAAPADAAAKAGADSAAGAAGAAGADQWASATRRGG